MDKGIYYAMYEKIKKVLDTDDFVNFTDSELNIICNLMQRKFLISGLKRKLKYYGIQILIKKGWLSAQEDSPIKCTHKEAAVLRKYMAAMNGEVFCFFDEEN